MPALLAAVWLTLALAACSTTAVQENADAASMRARPTLVLAPTLLPPVEPELFNAIVDRLEREMAASPYLGKVFTRDTFLRETANGGALRSTYELFSTTLAVAGISERSTANALGEFHQVELLLMAQLVYVPCPTCDEFHAMALAANLVEAKTGKVLWRAHLTERFINDTPENRRKVAESLVPRLLAFFEDSLRPKWQRVRFENLAKQAGG